MEGDEIIVVWGEESFMPVKFQGFRIGPYTIKTTIRQGEDYSSAFQRAWSALEKHADGMYRAKRMGFHERVRNAGV